MHETEWLAKHFEEHRGRLRAVAYRMLGSLTEADDAVQDTWLRVSGADTGDVENFAGWLTTILARVCLNMLRSRNVRREQPLTMHLPYPVNGRPFSVLAFTVANGRIVEIDVIADPERVGRTAAAVLG
jgi:DNA-directed RNA polymerase specialized sigma24 family protein